MPDDQQLLRSYAADRSETAFGELVSRHVNLVYSAALRQTNGDAQLAQDVAQLVFAALARKAKSIPPNVVLAAWLHRSTRFAARQLLRTERRRRAREQEAVSMDTSLSEPSLDWERIRPMLDQALDQLKRADREALLLRFFEQRSLIEVGVALGSNEDAARKRVARALDKLREFLVRRGVTTTAGALVAALSANAVQMAPAGLAATLTSTTLAGAATGTGATLTLLKLVTMTKLQAGLVSAVVIAGAATPLVIHEQSKLREENLALRQQTNQLASLTAENERLTELLAKTNVSPAIPQEQLSELLRLRGEVGELRRATNEVAKLRAENQQLRSVAASSPTRSSARGQTSGSQGSLPQESWAFAGYADPESAFQTTLWAGSRGDAKTFIASLSPDSPGLQEMKDQTENEIATKMKEEMRKVSAFNILQKEVVSQEEVILTVYADGINEAERFRLQRIGNEWKFGGRVREKPGDPSK